MSTTSEKEAIAAFIASKGVTKVAAGQSVYTSLDMRYAVRSEKRFTPADRRPVKQKKRST